MTEEFKNEAFKLIKQLYPLCNDDEKLRIAEILWKLIPEIYNKK